MDTNILYAVFILDLQLIRNLTVQFDEKITCKIKFLIVFYVLCVNISAVFSYQLNVPINCYTAVAVMINEMHVVLLLFSYKLFLCFFIFILKSQSHSSHFCLCRYYLYV